MKAGFPLEWIIPEKSLILGLKGGGRLPPAFRLGNPKQINSFDSLGQESCRSTHDLRINRA